MIGPVSRALTLALVCLWLGGLTVTPHLAQAAPSQLADAVLPAGVTLNWDKTNAVTVNASRAKVSLDGIWRFIAGMKR